MEVYVEVQPILVNKRIEEITAAQAAAEAQQQQLQQDTPVAESNQSLQQNQPADWMLMFFFFWLVNRYVNIYNTNKKKNENLFIQFYC